MLGRMVQATGQMLTVRVATELLSPAQIAGVTQMGSMAMLFNVLLIAPVWHYIARGFGEWRDTRRLVEYLQRYLVYLPIVTLVAMIAVWGLQSQFHLVNGFSTRWVVSLISIYMLSAPISTMGTTGFNLLNQRIKFVFFSNIPVWVGLGISVLLFRAYASPSVWSLGQFAGLSVGGLSFVMLNRKLQGERSKPSVTDAKTLPFTVHAIFGFAWPVVITAALWWMQSQSYRFVLDKIQGPAHVGLFTMGYGLAATPIAMYEGIFGQFYEPIYYNDLKGQGVEGQARAWNRYARAYLPGIFLTGVFVASSGTFLAQILLGEQFRAAAVVLVVWAAIIESIRATGAMMYHLGVAKVDMRINIPPVAAGAVLAPLGVLVCGRIDPLIGTAVGLLSAGLVVLVIIMVMSQKALPIAWPVRRIIMSGLLSIPLAFGFQIAKWFLPTPTTLSAVSVLACGGVYLLAVQALMFEYREKE
ncbi:hypothetical protein HYR99_03055 [Candidatus Poribacteria bacterium]|nr:hypothetical protein [Candidatus Poribacteria bacterium]